MLPENIKISYLKAGKIAGEARDYGASLIKVGASLLDVTEKVEQKVLDKGGSFAFPPQISLNKVAAHYCAEPGDETVFQEGDIAKLDVGVHIDGYIGDTAVTVDLGDHADLIKASNNALDNAISILKPGVTLGEIGRTIQETIQAYDLSPVRNLSGHGLDQFVFHGKPSIPNYFTGDPTQLKQGDVIALEPFATDGAGEIYESRNANIFSQINSKPVRNRITRQVLKQIESYEGLPFTTRWLAGKLPLFKVHFALKELMNKDVIIPYPPLPEKRGGMVSQAEHTVIIEDKPIVTTS